LNPYEVLGLANDAPMEEVTKAYRTLAKKYHPDVNPGHEDKMREINEAYDRIKSGDVEPKTPPEQTESQTDVPTGEPIRPEDFEGYHPDPDQQAYREVWTYKGKEMSKRKALFLQWWDRRGKDLLRYIVLPSILLLLVVWFLRSGVVQKKTQDIMTDTVKSARSGIVCQMDQPGEPAAVGTGLFFL